MAERPIIACARFDAENISNIPNQNIISVEDAYHQLLRTRKKGRKQQIPILHRGSTKTTHLHVLWVCANASRKTEYQRDSISQAFGITDKNELKKHINKKNETIYREDDSNQMEKLFCRIFSPQAFDVQMDLDLSEIETLENLCREQRNPTFFRLLRQYMEQPNGGIEHVCDGQKQLITPLVPNNPSSAMVLRQASDSPSLPGSANENSEQEDEISGKFFSVYLQQFRLLSKKQWIWF